MTKVNESFSECLCGQLSNDIMFKSSLSRISIVFIHNFKASNYLSVLGLAYFDSGLSHIPHLKHNYSVFLILRYFISSCFLCTLFTLSVFLSSNICKFQFILRNTQLSLTIDLCLHSFSKHLLAYCIRKLCS